MASLEAAVLSYGSYCCFAAAAETDLVSVRYRAPARDADAMAEALDGAQIVFGLLSCSFAVVAAAAVGLVSAVRGPNVEKHRNWSTRSVLSWSQECRLSGILFLRQSVPPQKPEIKLPCPNDRTGIL
jgi:hypothetical protein